METENNVTIRSLDTTILNYLAQTSGLDLNSKGCSVSFGKVVSKGTDCKFVRVGDWVFYNKKDVIENNEMPLFIIKESNILHRIMNHYVIEKYIDGFKNNKQ